MNESESPIALEGALRAALPPAHHALIAPLARTLEALADPTTRAVVVTALAQLGDQPFQFSLGAFTIAGGSAGDITMRDVAGGNIVHLTLNLHPPLGPSGAPAHGLDAGQLAILQHMATLERDQPISAGMLATKLQRDRGDVADDLELLRDRQLIKTNGLRAEGVVGVLLPAGRKVVQSFGSAP